MHSPKHGVSLWDLLTLISFGMPITGVFVKHPNQINVGAFAYALALMAGITLGGGFAAAMRYALVVIGPKIVTLKNRLQTLIGIGMLLAAFVWIMFAVFVGDWVAHEIFNALG